MVGGKLKLELIGNEKIRHRTFQNRQKGLRKKVHELSTLCGVEACMIICCPNGNGTYSSQSCVWPENHYEVERIILKYINERKEEHGKRTVDLSGVLESRKTRAKFELQKLQEKNGETKGQTSETGLELDGLSYEKLMEIVNKLDKKLESVESLIDLKRGEAGWMSETLVNCPDHMPGLPTAEPIDIHVAMDESAFQGSEMVWYDLDFPELSDGGVESDLTWTMMNLENNECPELGGGKTSSSELLYQSDPSTSYQKMGTVPTMQGTETIFYDLDFADLSNGGVEFDLNWINMENNEYLQLGGGRASSSDLLYQSDPAHGMFQNTDPSTSYQNMGTVPTMQGMSVSENTMMF
ncbi:hypothetical protein VitviT2T_006762 [Vitis vinifera]|uniref:MADS-box domain-containing protein n=1 Tax=Vitis vinifera TaxID=29760 RepID=A0ABY9BWS4_VITVI|nr:hypothetical protein VitviT2T_006762 [Vitis vinifera]